MSSAFALRSQIEATLANRIPSALTPLPRTIRRVVSTGAGELDARIGGGLPVGAITEMVGAECSGRTSLALAFLAQVIREGKVCAWVDVSDAMSPESAAAAGVDLARLLWVRCGVAKAQVRRSVARELALRNNEFSVPEKYFVSKPVVKGLHGGGMGGHPRDEAKGMDAAVSGLLQAEAIVTRFAEPQQRAHLKRESTPVPAAQPACVNGLLLARGKSRSRVEQALQVTDLLLQGGGFAAVVLDLGGVAADHVSRIPLATWFRYRAAAERTQSSVVLLTQYACAKSSAELVLRLETGTVSTQGGTVLTAFERDIEVARRRFVEEEKVVTIRKQPQRAQGTTWKTEMAWAGRGQR